MSSMAMAVDIVLKAVIVALLLRVAITDFKVQKIHNRDVLLLACAGLGSLVVRALQTDFLQSLDRNPWFDLKLALAAAAALFVLLFPFWIMRKVGAGDVKLMAAAPLVAGGNLPLFCIVLLILTVATAFAVKNPLLLPAPVFRRYLEHFDRRGVVPFGVPIAAALFVVTVVSALGL
jgi:prepilin peptidase CpaA